MRAINSATAAAVLGLEQRSFDNMIARIGASELPRGRQGLARRIPVSVLPRLLLTAMLADRLGIPYRQAYRVARKLLDGEQPGAPLIHVHLDLEALIGQVDARIEQAIESVVPQPRGRPRRS